MRGFGLYLFVGVLTVAGLHAPAALCAEDIDELKPVRAQKAIADISDALGGNPYAYQPR